MLSYRHGYHAGNFADVFKHFVLVYLLEYLKTRKPFAFFDAFAGAGKYNFSSEFMSKNKEYLTGINKLLKKEIKDSLVKNYINYVKKINNKIYKFYPGSCLFASLVLDEKDKIFLLELHKNEFKNLLNTFKKEKRAKIENKDAYIYLNKIISRFKKNSLVLIDPSYELKNEYDKVFNLIKHIYLQYPNITQMIWYPILENDNNKNFIKSLPALNILNKVNLRIDLVNTYLRMQGTGILIINPPDNMKENILNSLYYLLENLKENNLPSKINFL